MTKRKAFKKEIAGSGESNMTKRKAFKKEIAGIRMIFEFHEYDIERSNAFVSIRDKETGKILFNMSLAPSDKGDEIRINYRCHTIFEFIPFRSG